ncbi:hypothetical protein [Aquimarina megaterium]|nr:hypothetical protein [Aquimarina megaterium]
MDKITGKPQQPEDDNSKEINDLLDATFTQEEKEKLKKPNKSKD